MGRNCDNSVTDSFWGGYSAAFFRVMVLSSFRHRFVTRAFYGANSSAWAGRNQVIGDDGMKRLLVSSLVTLAGFACAGLAQAADLTINGSTTVLPILQKVSEQYMAEHPDAKLALSGGGSGNGIKALIDGLADVAMSSREIKSGEMEQAKAKGVEPVQTAVAVDAIVPVVHPANKVEGLTTDELRGIYMGAITNWKQVGGDDARIVVVSRDTSSGTYETWESMIMKGERVAPSALLQASNGAVVQAVAKNRNAIGYIGIGYVDKSTKGLQVNGKTATAATALSREWPLSRELYIYTAGTPTGEVKGLIDYILDPAKGQKAVAEVGFVPLGR